MKRIVKYIVGRTYKPLLVQYLTKTRTYQYKDIVLEIPSQVFHPGFFHSTHLLLKFISAKSLSGRSVLELGAGSGLLSVFAAKKGAKVVASDINPVAINYLKKNTERNGVHPDIIHSDLFQNIPLQSFDLILINPPYYKKHPSSHLDHAWYCGENGEYFQHLFQSLRTYIHKGSEVLMVLCDGCDMEMIRSFALQDHFEMKLVQEKKSLIETTYIFRIQPTR